MITIHDIQGNEILSVLVTQGCVKTEELMASDFIQLSWNSPNNDMIKAGSYIEYEGEKYYLIEPYYPTQKDKVEYTYTPQFHSRVILWKKLAFFLYTEIEEGKYLEEPDWQLTSNASAFMDCLVKSIKQTTNETWSYQVSSGLPASAFLHFDNTDILSALNSIANAFETEWYADKATNTIYLGKIALGNEIVLKVGDNIGVPSISSSNEGYYNRFYAFGSTRNISQEALAGTPVNSIANKRLTLDTSDDRFRNGYYDTEDNLSVGNTFVKTLYFDDIYPRATEGTSNSKGLRIADVRARLRYRIDDNNQKIEIGRDDSGNPIYEQYTIWYFKIPSLTDFSEDDIIEGKALSCTFETGALQGFEFELKYHDKDDIVGSAEELPFLVEKGDFEVLFVEENNIIIPSSVGLVPVVGDEVSLINIALPDSYIKIAQQELANALFEEIERMNTDYNSYQVKSNPIAFANNNYAVSVGGKVRYINGSYELSSRITAITSQLDYPIEKTITIGNDIKKGAISELKDEVANANQSIDIATALNKQTQSTLEAYKRTQEAIQQGFARIADMWMFYDDTTIISKYNVASERAISAGGVATEGGGGTGGGLSVSQMWAELAKKATSTSQIIDDSHIPSSIARITDLPDMTKYVEKGDMGDFLTKEDLMWKNITD